MSLRSALRFLDMRCRQYSELISRELDQPQPAGLRAAVRVHTAFCTNCRRFKRQVRFLHLAILQMRELRRGPAGMTIPVAVRDRLADRLRTGS
jgi:hypothetical protein